MTETIQKLDLNFTNSGGGHTATVSSIADSKNIDGSESLGTVVGDLGEINSFSNDKISEIMGSFICTNISVAADPTKKAVSRSYSHRVSLMLSSYILLVRGINCGIDKIDFDGPIPYFTEVAGSPLKSFKVLPPKVSGSVIAIGKVYNYEANQKFDGTKVSLTYQNKELKDDLSQNTDAATPAYLAAPDLAKYDLKFGYTAKEFKIALNLVGISVKGLPDLEDTLFETSGTLDSVLGSIASYYGYFWFLNPRTGEIQFINTSQASTLEIVDHTNSTDKNIISASFARAVDVGRLVNSYVGSAEKKENQVNDRNASGITRKIFFKRIFIERIPQFPLSHKVIGAFFALFNQRMQTETFNKFTYLLAHMNKERKEGEKSPSERIFEEKLDFGDLYPDEPLTHQLQKYHRGNPKLETIIPFENEAKAKHNRTPLLTKENLDRFDDEFLYFDLAVNPPFLPPNTTVLPESMAVPSTTELYAFLQAYFGLAGGFFISNGYTEYKAERIEWQNSGNVTILGPFKNDVTISEIDELQDFNEYLNIMKIDRPTIKDLVEGTNGKAKATHDFHFIAIRNIKQREKFKDDDFVDFKALEHFIEIWKPPTRRANMMGGPKTILLGQLKDVLEGIVEQSYKNFLSDFDKDKRIGCTYIRKQTRSNEDDPDGEEAEDNAIAESSAGDQTLSDLMDRFDLKKFEVFSPPHNILNKLTLSSFSGTVQEMSALASQRVRYDNAIDKPKTSSRTVYGLQIPNINATTNAISISVGPEGITTTINESTVKLIPPDQQFLTNRGTSVGASDRSIRGDSLSRLNAGQRNYLGL